MKNQRKLPKGFWLVLVVIIFFLIPIPIVSQLEERDSFCGVCHLAPEDTYIARAQDVVGNPDVPADLSSAHYQLAEEAFRCIDCHRGSDSFQDRIHTITLGARDTFIFFSRRADETIEKGRTDTPELLEASCLKCHQEALLVLGFNNHFHNQLPKAKEVQVMGAEPLEPLGGIDGELFSTLGESNTELTCLACHQAHRSILDGDLTLYLDVDAVLLPACVQCHHETGQGPLDLASQ
jgi:hypothetical protein